MGTTDKGKAVFVMNAGKTESDITDDSTSFDYGDHASKTTEAYLSTSVNPLFVQNNLQYENSVAGSSLVNSANFIEIRKTSHGGSISNDLADKIGNRLYPGNTTLTSFATNRDETHSFKVKVYDSQVANSETNRKFVYSTSNYPATEEIGLDIENYDYFILLNPDTVQMGADAVRPHFAKVTKIIAFDEMGDGLEFKPAYPTEIPINTKFEIYKGPAKTATDIVAVSYGLRGDTSSSTPKHDRVNVCSRPTWYFYDERLDEKDQLDYMTKYNATHLRWWGYSTNISITEVKEHAQFAVGSNTVKFITSGSSDTNKLSVGMSLFNTSDVYLGNIESISSNDVLLDFARIAVSATTSDFNVKVGKTIQNVIFRTEGKFDNTIPSLGKERLDAVLVDANLTSDDSNSSDFYRWQNAFPKMHRHTANSDTTTATTLDGNLTGPGKYVTFELANFKNNKIPLIIDALVNNPRNKMSQLAKFKVMDNSGLQHLKIKEEADFVIQRNIHNDNLNLIEFHGTVARDSSNTSLIVLSDIKKETELRAILSTNDIVEIDGYQYVVNTVNAQSSGTQSFTIKDKKLKTANTWTGSAVAENFSAKKLFLTPYTGVINTTLEPDTEYDYTQSRLKISGSTVDKEHTKLYNARLVSGSFNGHDNKIDYGDRDNKYLKVQDDERVFYQRSNENVSRFYYYTGGYAISDTVFSGIIEDISSSAENGMSTLNIVGRDETSKLLSQTVTKNTTFMDDILHTSIPPLLTATAVTNSGDSSPYANLTITGATVNWAGTLSPAPKRHGLLLNQAGELIGEVKTATSTSVTLYDDAFTTPTTTTSLKYYHPYSTTDDGSGNLLPDYINYITGTKALSSNDDHNSGMSGFTSISEKAIGFNGGLSLSGTYGDNSATFTQSKLQATSNDGDYASNRTLGYDISSPKAISTNDSIFAFNAGNENGVTVDKIDIASVNKESFDIVQVNEKDEANTTISVAPKFPVLLGRLDSNTSDTRGNSNIYLVNNGIDTGGFIHRLDDTFSGSGYFGPKETMRYWDLQKFNPGTLTKTHNSIYNNGTRTQKIQGYAVAYGVKADGTTFTPSATNDSKPLAGSNTVDGWTYATNFLGNQDDTPLIKSYPTIRDQTIGQGYGNARAGYASLGYEEDIQYSQFEQIDPRAETYELLAVGDLFPASKLRHNNIGYYTKDYSDYAIVLEGEPATTSSTSHEKYTGQTKQTLQTDNMFEESSISTSTQTTNQARRFGVMRLVEATFDWHFNPIDYESLPKAEEIPTVRYFDYVQADLPPTAETATNNIVIDADGVVTGETVSNTAGDVFMQGKIFATLADGAISSGTTNTMVVTNHTSLPLKVGDSVYKNDGTKIGVIASLSGTTQIVFESTINVSVSDGETLRTRMGANLASKVLNVGLSSNINGYVASYGPFNIGSDPWVANIITDSLGGGTYTGLLRYEGGTDYYGVQPFRLFSTTDFNIDNLSASSGFYNIKSDRNRGANNIRFTHAWICSPTVVSTNFKWTKQLVDSSNTAHTFQGHDIILPIISEEYKGTWDGSDGLGVFTREPDRKDRDISAFHYLASGHRHISRVVAGLYHRELSNTSSTKSFRYSVGQTANNSASLAHIYDGCIGVFRGFKQGANVHAEGFGADIIGNDDITLSTQLSLTADSTYSDFVTGNNNDFEQTSRNVMVQDYLKVHTTVATAYSDGQTSLVLEDASGFTSSGNGFINGVAFTWTNKSSNTLTVPDLDADYAVGVIVEQAQISLAMTGTKASASILSQNPELTTDTLGAVVGKRPFSSEATLRSSNIDAQQGAGGVFCAQMIVKPTFNITSGSNGVVKSGSNITFTLNSDTKHAWLSYMPNLTGYYLVSEATDYTVSTGNGTTTATLRNNTGHNIPSKITRITNHTISTAPTASNTEAHTITVDNSTITGRCRLMRPSEVAFDGVEGEIKFNTLLDDERGRDWRTGGSPEKDDPTYSESVYHMYLLLDVDNANSTIERRTTTTALTPFSDLSDGDVLDMNVSDGQNSERKKIVVKKTIDISDGRTRPGLTLQFDGSLNANGVASFGEVFEMTLGRKPKLKDIKTCHVGTTYSIGSQLEKEVENIVREAGLDYNNARSFSEPTGNFISNGATSSTTITCTENVTGISNGDVIYSYDGHLIGEVSNVSNAVITVTKKFYVPSQYDEIVKINKKTFVTNLKFDNTNMYNAVNSLITKRGLDYTIKNGEFVTRNIEDTSLIRKFALSYAESSRLIKVGSNKSMFDKANKIIVIGDKVQYELEQPTKKQTRAVKVIDPTIKTRVDAETKAVELMDIYSDDTRKIHVEVQKKGLELLEAGDIIRMNFPNHNIPVADYMVFEIENVLSGTLKLQVGTFDKTIAERLSELSTRQSDDSTVLLGRDASTASAGKFLFDSIKLKNISLSYTITGSSNELSRNSNMGFDDLVGFTEEVGFEHSVVTKKSYRDRFYEQEDYT